MKTLTNLELLKEYKERIANAGSLAALAIYFESVAKLVKRMQIALQITPANTKVIFAIRDLAPVKKAELERAANA